MRQADNRLNVYIYLFYVTSIRQLTSYFTSWFFFMFLLKNNPFSSFVICLCCSLCFSFSFVVNHVGLLTTHKYLYITVYLCFEKNTYVSLLDLLKRQNLLALTTLSLHPLPRINATPTRVPALLIWLKFLFNI